MTGHDIRDALATIAREAGSDAPSYARRLAPGRLTYTRTERRAILRYARRIESLLETASEEQWRDGLGWYARAHDAVRPLATGYGIWRTVTALAALSQGMAWQYNIAALHATHEIAAGGDISEVLARHRIPARFGYRPYYAALGALRGEDTLRGPKVRGFRDGIASRGMCYAVAVDGHAALAATHGPVERRPSITGAPSLGPRLYDVIAAAYAAVGHTRGLYPTAVQATAWIVWRAIPTNGRV